MIRIIKSNNNFIPFLLSLGNDADMEPRNAVYKEEAPALATQAALEAIKDWGGNKHDITHIVAVTCTGVIVPGISSYLISTMHPSAVSTCHLDNDLLLDVIMLKCIHHYLLISIHTHMMSCIRYDIHTGVEFHVMRALGLSERVERLSVMYMGCFGFISGMQVGEHSLSPTAVHSTSFPNLVLYHTILY
jgi:predicted naringenin-chalcone synthase